MNGHPPDITKHCGTAGKSHVNVVLAVVFSVFVLASGCHRSDEDEIRASFAKIPDYLLGTKHRCQAFVLYTFARMEDIPDETRRMKVLHDFTDRLFSVDISQTCPLENVGWEKKQDSLRRLRSRLDSLRLVAQDAYRALRMYRRPLIECWEVKFRCLEQYKHYEERIEILTGLKLSEYDTLVKEVERGIVDEIDYGTLSPEDYTLVRTHFEKIVGRPMRTKEEIDAEMYRSKNIDSKGEKRDSR